MKNIINKKIINLKMKIKEIEHMIMCSNTYLEALYFETIFEDLKFELKILKGDKLNGNKRK